jgi:Na+-translocating ferredoxin:NAD+ oxidoreductase subunit B
MTTLMIIGIGLVCGILIYIAFAKIPNKVQGLEKTEEIKDALPGLNCGACGYAGCFGLAEALTKNPELIRDCPCTFVLQDEERLKKLGELLGVKLDASAMRKKAVVKCLGNSEIIYDYQGPQSCKANVLHYNGRKKCPYACLGFGDCVKVCPVGAISIDEEKKAAVVDPEKCTGCGLCVKECPQNIIELVPESTKVVYRCSYEPLRDIPGREKCDFGCIHCRKCFKACEEEGIHAIEWDKKNARPIIDQDKCTLCRKCIEACPQNTLAEFAQISKINNDNKERVKC